VMTDKCWYGEPLVEDSGFVMVDDGKGGMERAPIQTKPLCPVHGGDCVWRPCTERRSHEDEGHQPIHSCESLTRLLGVGRFVVVPAICGKCDRPALVEAVKAGRQRLLDICQVCGEVEDDEDGNPVCPGCETREVIESMDAALAALPKGEGDGKA